MAANPIVRIMAGFRVLLSLARARTAGQIDLLRPVATASSNSCG